MARQGVNHPMLEEATVLDPGTMAPVARDGATLGEVMLRGNTVMKGYLRNPAANREAFAGGWFHTGDLGVMHPDGYIEVKDRAKDIVISGGENISTLEVEEVLYAHPAIMEAAVVAQPDEKWGEVPHAFVTSRPRAADRGRGDRLVPPASGAFQMPEARHLRRAAEDQHRQDPEIRTAAAVAIGVACPAKPGRNNPMRLARRSLLAAPACSRCRRGHNPGRRIRPVRILIPYTPGAINDRSAG